MEKNISIMRPTLRNFIGTRDRFERYGNEAIDMLKRGTWRVFKHSRYYSLEEIPQAHRDIESRGTMGKLLVKI